MLALLALLILPGLTLRSHHYIVALMTLPSTALPSRLHKHSYRGFPLMIGGFRVVFDPAGCR